jgi:hypothetical protein
LRERARAIRRFRRICNIKGMTTMRPVTFGLAMAMALASTAVFAQGARRHEGNVGAVSSGVTTGSAGSGMSTGAGSASAAANSAANPSGNSLINSSPSGSTLAPGGAIVGGRR